MGGRNDDAFGGSPRNQAFGWLSLLASVIGSFSSIITIVLIRRMKLNTGHIYLVYLMSIYQLSYDFVFFFGNVSINYYVTVSANIVQSIGGISGSLVSNWIAFIAMYIVLYRKRFDVFDLLHIIHPTCVIPGLATAIAYSIATIPQSHFNAEMNKVVVLYVYNNIRLLSIGLNFIFVLFTSAQIYRTIGGRRTPQDIAIRTLSHRMICYPIVQAIGRSGLTWYEFAYSAQLDADDSSDTEYSSLIFLIVVTPFTSVGYLMIFLIMQPNAYKTFKELFFCQTMATKEDESDKDDLDDTQPPSLSIADNNNPLNMDFRVTQSSNTSRKSRVGKSPVVHANIDAIMNTNVTEEIELGRSYRMTSDDYSVDENASHNSQSFVSNHLVNAIEWGMRTSSQAMESFQPTDFRQEDELYKILETIAENNETSYSNNVSSNSTLEGNDQNISPLEIGNSQRSVQQDVINPVHNY